MLAAFLLSGIGEKDLKIILLQGPMLTTAQDGMLQVLVLGWGGIQGESPALVPALQAQFLLSKPSSRRRKRNWLQIVSTEHTLFSP